jgi:uncharacterized Zn finger protein
MPSVADLVEPAVLRERAGEYLSRAGDVLRAAGVVRIVTFTPVRVDAEVSDGGTRHVELAASGDGLAVTCDCGSASASGWCPHAVATAFETWERAPKRRGPA